MPLTPPPTTSAGAPEVPYDSKAANRARLDRLFKESVEASVKPAAKKSDMPIPTMEASVIQSPAGRFIVVGSGIPSALSYTMNDGSPIDDALANKIKQFGPGLFRSQISRVSFPDKATADKALAEHMSSTPPSKRKRFADVSPRNPDPETAPEHPGPTTTAVSAEETTKLTGYSEYRTKLMAKAGKLVGAYKVKGKWMIPTPVMIRANDGKEVVWKKGVKDIRPVDPSATPSTVKPSKAATTMNVGGMEWTPLPHLTGEEKGGFAMRGYYAVDSKYPDIVYDTIGTKWAHKPTWEWVTVTYSVDSNGRKKKIFASNSRLSGGIGKPYKSLNSAMKWANKESSRIARSRRSLGNLKRPSGDQPKPSVGPSPLTQESLNKGRR